MTSPRWLGACVTSAVLAAGAGSACSASHSPGADGGRDARVADAGLDAPAILDAGSDANLRCALSGATLADGRPIPACEQHGRYCNPGFEGPHYFAAACQFGLCCEGTVDPETCECRCGAHPACWWRKCCRPEPGLRPDLPPDELACLLDDECVKF